MKTILITGSTDGIGKLTAIKLAYDGHQIILHGRNPEKLKKTLEEIKVATKNNNIYSVTADLSDTLSIHKMISEISKEYSCIDVLINNAGVFKSSIAKNNKNLDLRFAVNFIAPYLLTNGLLSLLNNSSAPRIINLSSAAQATVAIEALKGNTPISSNEAYAQSKLALTMWSFDFAKKHQKIITIAVNPGSLLNTNMVKEAYGQYWSSADKGADILYELATLAKHESANGKYFDNDKGDFAKAHLDAYNQEKIEQLILETNKILKR